MRQPRPVVPLEFAAQVRDIVLKAKYHGADYIEVLNRKDLLNTPAKERENRVESLNYLAREWDRWQPHEMLRRKHSGSNPCTPADMFYVMREFLDEFIEHEKTKEW